VSPHVTQVKSRSGMTATKSLGVSVVLTMLTWLVEVGAGLVREVPVQRLVHTYSPVETSRRGARLRGGRRADENRRLTRSASIDSRKT
jgi:hypothetical protein